MKNWRLIHGNEKEAYICKIVNIELEHLSEQDKNYLINNPNPSDYHFGYGMYIRNHYCHSLKDGLVISNPDEFSHTVIERIIDRLLPEDAPPREKQWDELTLKEIDDLREENDRLGPCKFRDFVDVLNELRFLERVTNEIIAQIPDDKKRYMKNHPDPERYQFELGMYVRLQYIYDRKLDFWFSSPEELSSRIVASVVNEISKATTLNDER